MSKKRKLVIFVIIIIGIILAFFNIDFILNEIENEKSHNNKWVKNCIPADTHEVVPLIGIENRTHHFDLSKCKWIQSTWGYEDSFSGSIKIGEYSNFNYQITSGLVDSLDYNVDSNSLIIEITSIKDGEFNLTIPTGKDDLFKDGICEKNGQIPDSEDIMVLIDGEEVESDISEINNDLINVKIQFEVNAKIIEVIQTCLV